MGHSLDQALIDRFRSDMTAALGRRIDRGDTLAVAVSGGPDSMAMLALATSAFPGQVVAATVDHRLRAGSADEAAMVATWCDSHTVPHATLVPDHPIRGASIQAQARTARYALLDRWATASHATALATAHHVDDQAETFLMRAARASGLSGLAAIRESREGTIHNERPLLIVRPLLGWRRAELRTIAESGHLPFVDDPSNEDLRHDRSRIRALLAEHPWLDVASIARSARYLGEAERSLSACLDLIWDDRITATQTALSFDATGLDRELCRRAVRRAITHVRATNAITTPHWSDTANVEPLLDALTAGKTATQAGIIATATGTIWRFGKAPPRRSH